MNAKSELPADAAADAGVTCPVEGRYGWHGLRYAEGGWYCPLCFASLRLGVWHPARNDDPDEREAAVSAVCPLNASENSVASAPDRLHNDG